MIRSRTYLVVACLFISVVPALATFEGGNGVYRVFVGDVPLPRCGTWTAQTGSQHPAGPGLDVTFGFGTPTSSYTTLHSYTSGTSYTTGAVFECAALCDVAEPVVEPLIRDGVTVGFRMTWVVPDGSGPMIEVSQEVTVDGPVDGTEDADNSVIRETHRVTNLGPDNFRFGLRKMWDWTVAGDDGPLIGNCTDSGIVCDGDVVNAPRNPLQFGSQPRSFFVTDSAAVVDCSPGVGPPPDLPVGCDGAAPSYLVAVATSPPTELAPRPYPGDVLAFGGWSSLFGECWDAPVFDQAECGVGGFPDDDTATAIIYGPDQAQAFGLRPGASRSFTQFLGVGIDRCPAPFVGSDPGSPSAVDSQ